MLRIGEVARRAGVDAQTIRYYERIGLLPSPSRTAAGYRQYDEQSLARLAFIRRAKEAGFTLKDIRLLLGFAQGRRVKCATVQGFIEDRLQKVRQRLRELRAIEEGLSQLLRQCRRQEILEECPALRELLAMPVDEGER